MPGLSLIAVSEGYTLVAVCGLLIVVASPVVEQGWALGCVGFSSCGAHGLSCSAACEIRIKDGTRIPCTGRHILYH